MSKGTSKKTAQESCSAPQPEQVGAADELDLREDEVAVRAYYLWENEGYQHGRDNEHWFRAEEQLRNEILSKIKPIRHHH